MAKHLQFRRDTALNWQSLNPTPVEGEMCLDLTNGLFKIGDGVNPWNALPYGGLTGDLIGIYDGGSPDSNYGGYQSLDGGTP